MEGALLYLQRAKEANLSDLKKVYEDQTFAALWDPRLQKIVTVKEIEAPGAASDQRLYASPRGQAFLMVIDIVARPRGVRHIPRKISKSGNR
jgi:hypothetical protein